MPREQGPKNQTRSWLLGCSPREHHPHLHLLAFLEACVLVPVHLYLCLPSPLPVSTPHVPSLCPLPCPLPVSTPHVPSPCPHSFLRPLRPCPLCLHPSSISARGKLSQPPGPHHLALMEIESPLSPWPATGLRNGGIHCGHRAEWPSRKEPPGAPERGQLWEAIVEAPA